MTDETAEEPATGLTRSRELALAAITGATVANAYYIHPIISEVADGFGVSDAAIGVVPAFNQLALALGILLLLPLGDRFGNRNLSLIFASAQTAMLAVMAFARDFTLFVGASTLLGFVTIVPYLLPAYVSKRVPVERLGQATATLTVGIIIGILIARVGAGILTEHFGWRSVYIAAALIMLVITLSLPRVMEPARKKGRSEAEESYAALLGSMLPLLRKHPEIFLSGAIQALNFGIFLSVWLGLALHLTSDEMGYGVDTVGYLAGIAAVSIYFTPRIGRWADSMGPRRARFFIALIQFAAITLYYPFGWNLWLLIIPIIITNVVGPSIDVTSRMTFLSLDPGVRTRLMTVFIVMMFVGGGIASSAGTYVYEHAGWAGNSMLAIAMSAVVVVLSWVATRKGE